MRSAVEYTEEMKQHAQMKTKLIIELPLKMSAD
jgi:hypothetical protein